MIKKITISQIIKREGDSERGHWVAKSLHIHWTEESSNGSFPQDQIASVKGSIKEQDVQWAIAQKLELTARIYFSTETARNGSGQVFNRVYVELPADYYEADNK